MLTSLVLGAIAAAIAGTGGRDAFRAIVRFWRRAISRRVDDPDARAAGLVVVEQYEQHAEQFASIALSGAEALAEVQRRYASNIDDYERVIAALMTELFPVQAALVDDGIAMREALGDAQYLEILADVEAKLAKAKAKRERKAEG